MNARYDMQNPAALKRLVAGGTQLRPFTNEVLEACLRRPTNCGRNLRQGGLQEVDLRCRLPLRPVFWWQVAEYTYDSFMIRSRTRG
jgi:TRAP-type mannitol/chloroaromatic compound transport system substrate-binding protein